MTASALASLLHARKIGRGRWTACCPAHGDRHPSLQIAEGRKGVLLRCMSMGCETKAILDALGLGWSDLFTDTRPDPETLRKIREQDAKAEREKTEKRRIKLQAMDQAGVWEKAAQGLGHLLMVFPGDDRLDTLYRWSLSQMRTCERIAVAHGSPGEGFPPCRRDLAPDDVGEEIGIRLGIWRKA